MKQLSRKGLKTKSFFAGRGWKAFPFQWQACDEFLAGRDAVIYSATGTGKTIAALLGPAEAYLKSPLPLEQLNRRRGADPAAPLQMIWITPLRALSADTADAIAGFAETLELPWSVERRTGDVSSSVKSRQKTQLPSVLVTTPESLSLLLTYETFTAQLGSLRSIVVDEWHELLGTKRGVQTELAMARLSASAPTAVRTALSATLGNLDEALAALQCRRYGREGVLIAGESRKELRLTTLMPPVIERFPWAGHLGISMAEAVATQIDAARSTLVFTNTRNQTEHWYQQLLRSRPTLAGQLALHHGSLDSDVRHWVEQGLKEGKLKAVVCTSSLDLGVDFTAVDQVIQIGSPKGAARLLQRAGRSGHRPGEPSQLAFVPTNALELIELAAVRDLLAAGDLEHRRPLLAPLDVLSQHLVTMALGGGFDADEAFDEIRTAYSYRDLSRSDFDWAVDFVVRGGESLRAYDDYRRVEAVDGRYVVTDSRVAKRHRWNIGTITGDAVVQVRYMTGARLGTVEEQFIARLKPGDRFLFAGKLLQLVRIADNAAWVRKAKGTPTAVPRWEGGRLPLSSQLADGVRSRLQDALEHRYAGVEMQAARPLLELQREWSVIPAADELLVEHLQNREGFHLFLFPFAGRLVHEGLSSLLAYRLARERSVTFHMAINDYGLLLHSPEVPPIDVSVDAVRQWFSLGNLLEDCLASLNAGELGRRQFRDIARVAGLISSGGPGRNSSQKHLQASSNLFFEVFNQYDPSNLLLEQSRREVLQHQLEWQRLVDTLSRVAAGRITLCRPERPTPLAFPLLVDRLRQKLSTESLADRVRKLQVQLEVAAGAVPVDTDASASAK